jgi:hypothetical protein
MRNKKLSIWVTTTVLLLTAQFSCNDYLDIVPDDIPTLNHAFSNHVNAENYLFGCYSYLPDPANPLDNPAIIGWRESWYPYEGLDHLRWGNGVNIYGWRIALGYQNTNDPLVNYWDGGNGGNSLFTGIRDCNIFLENIDKVRDMEDFPELKNRWKAEAKFLKAYYHFYLLRNYGPIPIVETNIPVSAGPDEVRVYREPVNKVVEYIASLLDEAAKDLPLQITDRVTEMGRITKPVALAVKAQALTLAASPLFNGNPYFANLKDNRDVYLFPREKDNAKWETAAKSIKEAIDVAHEAGHSLYYYPKESAASLKLNDTTVAELNIRYAVTERWNSELVWGSTINNDFIQELSQPRFYGSQTWINVNWLGPTIETVERFYTNHGIPIEEDHTWDYAGRYKIKVATAQNAYYLRPGFESVNLHFDREPRFYASALFDGCSYYGNGKTSDKDMPYVSMKKGNTAGKITMGKYSITGYLSKKLVHPLSVSEEMNTTRVRYPFPFIRLSDLYLLYAEALNETKSKPDAEVYEWIDLVRRRASLNGVVESWANYSEKPEKPLSQSGMRDIIHQERMIELALEGTPYWDMLRWKEAGKWIPGSTVRGWNIEGGNTDDYYQLRYYNAAVFRERDYLMPLKQSSLDVNRNLVQNPGW